MALGAVAREHTLAPGLSDRVGGAHAVAAWPPGAGCLAPQRARRRGQPTPTVRVFCETRWRGAGVIPWLALGQVAETGRGAGPLPVWSAGAQRLRAALTQVDGLPKLRQHVLCVRPAPPTLILCSCLYVHAMAEVTFWPENNRHLYKRHHRYPSELFYRVSSGGECALNSGCKLPRPPP